MTTAPQRDREFLRHLAAAVGALALIAVLYALANIFLLVFGAVLLALLLRAAGLQLERVGVSPTLAMPLAGALIACIIAAAAALLGSEIVAQLSALWARILEAAQRLAPTLDLKPEDLLRLGTPGSGIGAFVAKVFAWSVSAAGALVSLIVVVFGGAYLAADPDRYRAGMIRLLPPHLRASAEAVMDEAAIALRRWIGAQLVAMALVGVLTGAGLWLAGVPSAAALGLVAGIAEFIPYVGPLLSGGVALLVAAGQGWQEATGAIAVVLVVQQIESNLIMPLLLGRSVSLPPAVGLFAVIAMGVLLGPLGVLLAVPLVIVAEIALRRLYVGEVLGEDARPAVAPAPSEQAREQA